MTGVDVGMPPKKDAVNLLCIRQDLVHEFSQRYVTFTRARELFGMQDHMGSEYRQKFRKWNDNVVGLLANGTTSGMGGSVRSEWFWNTFAKVRKRRDSVWLSP